MPTPQEVTLLESWNSVYDSNLSSPTSNPAEKAAFLFRKIRKQQENPATVFTSDEKQIMETAKLMKTAGGPGHQPSKANVFVCSQLNLSGHSLDPIHAKCLDIQVCFNSIKCNIEKLITINKYFQIVHAHNEASHATTPIHLAGFIKHLTGADQLFYADLYKYIFNFAYTNISQQTEADQNQVLTNCKQFFHYLYSLN